MSETSTPFAAPEEPGTALVTGATGYIGGLLVPRLLDDGWTVRVLTRSSERLRGRDWADRVEVVEGDATSEADLRRALSGTDVAYYLVHSMDGGGDLARRDRELAEGFAAAAGEAQLPQGVPATFRTWSVSNAGSGTLYNLGSTECGSDICPTLLRSGADGESWQAVHTFNGTDTSSPSSR